MCKCAQRECGSAPNLKVWLADPCARPARSMDRDPTRVHCTGGVARRVEVDGARRRKKLRDCNCAQRAHRPMPPGRRSPLGWPTLFGPTRPDTGGPAPSEPDFSGSGRKWASRENFGRTTRVAQTCHHWSVGRTIFGVRSTRVRSATFVRVAHRRACRPKIHKVGRGGAPREGSARHHGVQSGNKFSRS